MKFKVGDKVRIVDGLFKNRIVRITDRTAQRDYGVEIDGSISWIYERSLERVDETKFKVGDRVKCSSPAFKWHGHGTVTEISNRPGVCSSLVAFDRGGITLWFEEHELVSLTESKPMKIAGYEVKILSKTEAMVGCAKVTLTDLDNLWDAMDAYVAPKPQFRHGDFVKVIDSGIKRLIGKHGKVIEIAGPQDACNIGVEFAEKICLGSCDGKTKLGHGDYFSGRQLELID
jgi:transcription antitermination factor NusG